MSRPTPNLCVCPACNYDLRGAFDNNDPDPTCPECGAHLRPTSPDALYTRAKLHRQLRRQILAPTCLAPLAFAPLTAIPGIVGEVAIGLFTLIGGIGYPFLYLLIVDSTLTKASRHPRPIARWVIPPIALLYALPGIALSVGLLFGFTRFLA